jgi:replicative DNA helicase
MKTTTKTPIHQQPFSSEAERGLLACCLLNPAECVSQCVSELQPGSDAFFDGKNRIIYEAILEIYDANDPLDTITLTQRLKDKRMLNAVGGVEEIALLPDAAPSSFNLPAYIKIVQDKFVLRRVIETCYRVVERAESNAEVSDLLDFAERDILSIRSLRGNNQAFNIKRAVEETMLLIEKAHQRGGMLTGASTGLVEWDRLTGGLHPGEVTILAGLPGHGKTALAMNVAEHVALDSNQAVGIFSLEMSITSLLTRMICSRGRVSLRNMRDGFMKERDWPQVAEVAGALHNSAVLMDGTTDLTISELRARARRYNHQNHLALIVVDYLQLVSGGRLRTENRQEEVALVSRGLKAMSMELNLPVIALSQINDAGQLRESRAISQDADNVAVLEWDDEKKTDGEGVPVTLQFRKQRNGPTGSIPLTFIKSFTRFETASKV